MELIEKNDSRRIDFVDEFLPGGKLYGFRKIIDKAKADNFPLELCFRGNSGNMAVIYYNNHRFFILQKSKGYFTLSIIFNHAKYTFGWEKLQDQLINELGFINKDGYMICKGVDLQDDEFILKVYEIMKLIFIDYFDKNKQTNEFRRLKNNRMKPVYIEKIRQQELMRNLNNIDNGYFVYNLEFQQAHKNKEEKEKDKSNNKPDMLAVKFSDRKPEKLIFIEVKSTRKSCGGKSGFDKHRDCMIEYINQKKKLSVRKKEACGIINDYAKLQLRGLVKDYVLSESQFVNLDVEILFIFTDEAILFYNKHIDECKSKERITYALYDEKQTKLPIM
ncbi:MAG: hypothetical protein K0S41_253 [Anaerocolumna sp.]|jgi:hypothetical protein|nr:hypothetical protein [Anaerocolumna sp.]